MKWFKSKKKEAEEAQGQNPGIDMRTKYKCRYCGEIFDTHDRDRKHGLWEGSIFKEVLTYEEQGHPNLQDFRKNMVRKLSKCYLDYLHT